MTAAPGPAPLAGRCLCGAVRYEVEDAFEYAVNCHCSQCRRTTGSAFKPLAGIRAEKARLIAGADRLLVVGKPTAGNIHCAACGSLLYSIVRDAQYVHVAMGTLEDAPRHPADQAHLRRLEGAVVHHHRRPAPVRGVLTRAELARCV